MNTEATEQALAKQLYSDPSASSVSSSSGPRLASAPLRDVPEDYQDAVGVRVWNRMRQLFGQHWTRDYGDAAEQTRHAWQGALGQFTTDEIGLALQNCQEWTAKFPPTFPEFRALCLSARHKLRPNWTEQRIAREKDTGQGVSGLIQHFAKGAKSEAAEAGLVEIGRILVDEEVQTRDESMRRLGLHRRWQS